MTLSDVKLNTEYKITKVSGGEIKRRLLDMGFAPGCKIIVKSFAPFGSTALVEIRGISVALRKSATQVISVEEIK